MRNIGMLLRRRAAPARVAATVSILFGLASLTGWLLGIQALTSVIPESVEMKANTALCVAASGIALLMLANGASTRLDRLAQILSAAVAAVGLATLAEYLFGVDLGIDEFLVRDTRSVYNIFHGRMSPFSAAAFVAIAVSLVALPHRRLSGMARLGAAFGLCIGLVSLLGYLWDAGELVTGRWLPPVALNTAACFALLGGGVLLVPQKTGKGLDEGFTELAAVEIKILAGFIVALLLLLIGGSYTYRTNAEFADAVEWTAHRQEVRAAVASIYGSLAGAEVALRDYLLTKDDANRTEYERQTADVQRLLADANALTLDNAAQQHNLAVLRPIVAGRLAAMASALTAFTDFGLPAARAVINVTRRSDTTQDVHARTAIMDAEEVRLPDQRQRQTMNARHTTLISLLVTLTVASSLFAALFRGVHKEMRARRDAEAALRASDGYNRSILDSSPDCLGVLDLDGRLRRMTPHSLALMDIDDFATVENADWVKIWKGGHRAAAQEALHSARSGIVGRFQGFCPTVKGTPKWWDVIVMPIMGSDGRTERLLAVARDISEVKKTEDDLRSVNRFLDSLFESLPVMVFVKDARTLRYIRMNRECERMAGFSRDEMLGKTARDLLPADQAEFIELKDREVLATGKMVEITEETVDTPEFGQRTRHTMKLPILDENGAPQYLLGISTDVTERKLAEDAIQELNSALEAKASQLQATNKELESFSYSVSHDLRAPLRAIDGFALMIQEDYHERLDDEGRRYLAVIRENSKRMGALIDDLLQFSRLGRLPVLSHDINVESLVREVVEEALIGRQNPALRVEIGPLPAARGDPGLLRQVWMNLISNAIKYSSKSKSPTIQVSGERNGTENLYSVRDNGVGFDMEYVEKLFGVFQRLHRADEFTGTGVGLAIVHRVVTRHGGRVWAEGKVNEGAVFAFALPTEVCDG